MMVFFVSLSLLSSRLFLPISWSISIFYFSLIFFLFQISPQKKQKTKTKNIHRGNHLWVYTSVKQRRAKLCKQKRQTTTTTNICPESNILKITLQQSRSCFLNPSHYKRIIMIPIFFNQKKFQKTVTISWAFSNLNRIKMMLLVSMRKPFPQFFNRIYQK